MSLSAIIDALIAAGGTIEQVQAVVRAHEATNAAIKQRSPGAERQARYRARLASQSITSDVTRNIGDGSDAFVTICDGAEEVPASPIPKEIPPAPPKEITLFPTNLPKTNTVRKANSAKSKTNGSPEYPAEFNLLWREFPRHPNASKVKAYEAWLRLPEEDRDKCLDGAVAYGAFLEAERRKRPDYSGLHLSTFLNERRFDSLLEARH